MTNAALVVDHLSFRWSNGGLNTLSNLSFTIARGERVALLGISGIGKTTLAKIVAGLLQPTEGRVDFPEADRQKAKVDIAFQNHTLLPWLSVLNNVTFASAPGSSGRKRLRTEAEAILRSVGLAEVASLYPDRLSGGMRQRASVARAIFRHCRLTVLDEPFSALDLVTRESLYSLVEKTSFTHDMAYLLVTHLPEDAYRACTRSLVLNDGGSNLEQLVHSDFRDFEGFRMKVFKLLQS